MSNPLKPNEISDLLPNQSIYELINGQEWIVESTSRNEFTRLAVLRKKDRLARTVLAKPKSSFFAKKCVNIYL